nr:MAG TPA: hypothetical protein [Caudoviricetes sp.]
MASPRDSNLASYLPAEFATTYHLPTFDMPAILLLFLSAMRQ